MCGQLEGTAGPQAQPQWRGAVDRHPFSFQTDGNLVAISHHQVHSPSSAKCLLGKLPQPDVRTDQSRPRIDEE
jgi:hypothetical protein